MARARSNLALKLPSITTEPAALALPPFHDWPKQYAMALNGTCLSGLYEHGETLVFDQDAEPKRGDCAALWIVGADRTTGERKIIPWIKRLLLNVWVPRGKLPIKLHPDSNAIPVVQVEALNPPQAWSLQLNQVYGMHKCLGRASDLGVNVTDPFGVRRRLAKMEAAHV